MNDLISRQSAITALSNEIVKRRLLDEMYDGCIDEFIAEEILKKLPSAQPEIVYCGDCKYKDDGIDEDGIPFLKCLHGRSYGGTRINDFCSWAERREE